MAKTPLSVTDTAATFSKAMADFPFAPINFEAMLDGQCRSWAAVVAANKVWSDRAQTLAHRQIGIARQAAEDYVALVEGAIRNPDAFAERLEKSAACVRRAFDGFCDLADYAAKSNTEVTKLFNRQMTETFDEMRTPVRRVAAEAAD